MTILDTPVANYRLREHPCDDLFLQRWSPRAMSGRPITRQQLLTLLEAGRWAPSSYNEQPWRFIYAQRDDLAWPKFLGLLMEANRVWSAQGAALIVVVSRKNFTHNDRPNAMHSFDCGSAWMSIALQASRMGLVSHGMAGFDHDRATHELGVTPAFNVEMMCVIGHPGEKNDLPQPLQAKEQPSQRKPLKELVMEGHFTA